MSSIAKQLFAVAFAAALVFFTNLGVPQLWDEDEPRNAACAREMLERGDWVVPTFNYELRTQKPVLLYWMMMAAYGLFGVSEFSARLPSAVLAVGTALVTYGLGRLLFNPRVGLLGGLMMASCLMFGVSGRAATPDSTLVFFTSLSLLAFAWSVSRVRNAPGNDSGSVANQTGDDRSAWLRDSQRTVYGCFLPRRWIDFALIYAAMAMAALAKGPIGIVLPVATIGLFLLVVHRENDTATTTRSRRLLMFAHRFAATTWSMRPLTLALMTAAIAAPWYVLVSMRTDGEWTRGFFGTENLARFQSAMENHSGPIVYYLGAILVGFFPWSIVLPAGVWFAVRDALRRGGRHPGQLLLVCWAGLWIGLFSIASTKLPSYVLPAYPALALMAASFVDRWLRRPGCVPGWLMHIAWSSLISVGLCMTAGLPLLAKRYLPGEELIGLVGLIPLTGGVAAMVLHRRNRALPAVVAVSLTAILLSVALLGGVAVRASRYQNSASLVAIAREHSAGEIRLATFAHPESSVVYYAATRIERCQQPAEVARFLAERGGEYVITSAERWNELRAHLPFDIAVVARQRHFLKEGEVLLLGREIETVAVPSLTLK